MKISWNSIKRKTIAKYNSIFNPHFHLNSFKAPKITSFLHQSKQIQDRQKEMDEDLVKIMVRQNASFCFFDDAGVHKLCKKAYPDLKVALII